MTPDFNSKSLAWMAQWGLDAAGEMELTSPNEAFALALMARTAMHVDSIERMLNEVKHVQHANSPQVIGDGPRPLRDEAGSSEETDTSV